MAVNRLRKPVTSTSAKCASTMLIDQRSGEGCQSRSAGVALEIKERSIRGVCSKILKPGKVDATLSEGMIFSSKLPCDSNRGLSPFCRGRAVLLDHLYHSLHVLDWRVGQDAVTEVEDMAGAAAGPPEYVVNPGAQLIERSE